MSCDGPHIKEMPLRKNCMTSQKSICNMVKYKARLLRFSLPWQVHEHFQCTLLAILYIYILTAVGLTPGGSSTVHIYTQTIHRTTQETNWEECGPCPVLANYTLAFTLQLRKKHRKTSVRVVKECQFARWKRNIQNRTNITIKIHNLQN